MQRGIQHNPSMVELAQRYIKERYAKPGQAFVGMVHRLDGPVAGVLVLARTSKAAARLSAQFRQRAVAKTYLAVIPGCPAQPSGRLEHYLTRIGRLCRAETHPTPDSQRAVLSYRLIEQHQGQSLLEIALETGRRHQIRSQLAAIGCPIIGDHAYGSSQRLAEGRIALLAYRLRFNHPTRQDEVLAQTPPPIGWPWPVAVPEADRPLWTIEAYQRDGFLNFVQNCC